MHNHGRLDQVSLQNKDVSGGVKVGGSKLPATTVSVCVTLRSKIVAIATPSKGPVVELDVYRYGCYYIN